MSGASPRPLSNPDVVANTGACADEVRNVGHVAGKASVLDGPGREKLEMLRWLAGIHCRSADWMSIPETRDVIGPDGERLSCARLSVLSDEYSKSVHVVPSFEKLTCSAPEYLGFYAAKTLVHARISFSSMRVAGLLNPPAQGQKKAPGCNRVFTHQYLTGEGVDSVHDINPIAGHALAEWDDDIAILDAPPSQYWPRYAERCETENWQL